MIDIEREGVF